VSTFVRRYLGAGCLRIINLSALSRLKVSGLTVLQAYFAGRIQRPQFLLPEQMDLQELGHGSTKHYLTMNLSNIVPSFERVKFNYQKKTFPKLSDNGVADVALRGTGAAILLKWVIESSSDHTPQVAIDTVKCQIDKLFIRIIGKETKHSLMDKFALSFLKGTIKKKIQVGIEQALYSNIQSFNDRINMFLSKKRNTTTMWSTANSVLDRAWTAGGKITKKGKKAPSKLVENEPVRQLERKEPKFVAFKEPAQYDSMEQPFKEPLPSSMEQPMIKPKEEPLLKSKEEPLLKSKEPWSKPKEEPLPASVEQPAFKSAEQPFKEPLTTGMDQPFKEPTGVASPIVPSVHA